MEDILVNLLANAGKYAPEGTPIRVEIATVGAAMRGGAVGGRPAAAAPPAGEPGLGTLVEVRVIDQGPGIPEAEQGAVFERFRRGQGAGGGVGLGLYIARAYVEAMGGEIGVRSRPEAGRHLLVPPPGRRDPG